MYLTLRPTLTLPFVDVDRKGGNQNNGGLSARAWIVLAFAVFVAAWLYLRVNGYFVR
jgi:hypothetical protein